MADLTAILAAIIATIIFIPLSALILWAATKLFKLADSKFLTALKTAAVSAVVLFAAQQVLGTVSDLKAKQTTDTGSLLVISITIFAVTTAITFLVNSYAVKLFYKEDIRKAFLVGITWSIVDWIVSAIIIGIIITLIFAIGISTGLA